MGNVAYTGSLWTYCCFLLPGRVLAGSRRAGSLIGSWSVGLCVTGHKEPLSHPLATPTDHPTYSRRHGNGMCVLLCIRDVLLILIALMAC